MGNKKVKKRDIKLKKIWPSKKQIAQLKIWFWL